MGGDARVQQALAAGSVEFGMAADRDGIRRQGRPGDGGRGVCRTAAQHIGDRARQFALPTGPADLKGKKIAVSTAGSLSDWLAKQMAIQEGWGQDEIQVVPLGAIQTSIAALKTRQVDAVVLATRSGLPARRGEARTRPRHDGRYAPHFITHVVFAQKSLIANNPTGDALSARVLCGDRLRRDPQGGDFDWPKQVLQLESGSGAQGLTTSSPGCSSDDGRFEPQAVSTLKQSFIDMKTLRSEPTDAELFATQFVPVRP